MIFIQKWPRCQTMTPCRKFLLYKSRNELQILTLNWIVNTPPWYRKSGQNADFQGNLMFIPPIIQVSLRLWSLELNHLELKQRKSEKVNSFLKTSRWRTSYIVSYKKPTFLTTQKLKQWVVDVAFGPSVIWSLSIINYDISHLSTHTSELSPTPSP